MNKIFFIFFTCLSLALLGCDKKDIPPEQSDLEKARILSEQSEDYYKRSISQYMQLIRQGSDEAAARLELGKLYYNHGEFKQAIEEFKKLDNQEAKRLLAVSYYKQGNYTDALEVFNQLEGLQDEYLYFKGLTSEKLNLYDQALEVYKKITIDIWRKPALERINSIEKQVNPVNIKDISPEVYQILSNAPASEQYPQAGGLILYADEKIKITPENTMVSSMHYLIKILNERGKEEFAEVHLEYDSTYEKIELEYARTIKPDGSVVDVGSRHIRDVSKYLNFPLYSNARVQIISFPEIAEGSTIEYKLKIYRNQLVNKNDFVLHYSLQDSQPIIRENFSIELPKEVNLRLKNLNTEYNNFGAKLEPVISLDNQTKVYSWQFRDIPQIIPESNMPPGAEINTAVLISTFESWQEVYDWWWALAKDKIRADDAIKEKVKALIKSADSPEDIAAAISNFVAQKIRYVAVEYGQAGYEPHKAEDIFRNKYGDCKDQAILLVTMLREAGLSAWPVLIPTKEYYNLGEDLPAMFFNHAIAAVALKDKTIFVDPTAETCAFGSLPAGDQNRKVLLCKENGYVITTTPLYSAGQNIWKHDVKVEVKPDESISGKKSVFVSGIYDQMQRYWFLYTPPELIEQELEEKIQEISIGAILDGFQIKNLENLNTPVELYYSFHGSEYFTVAGKLRILSQLASLDPSLVAKDQRKYPIDFGVLDTREGIWEMHLPPNFTVKYLPEAVDQDSPWFKFRVDYHYKDQKITFRQKIELKKQSIGQSEYPEFKKYYENLAKKIKQKIVIEKIR